MILTGVELVMVSIKQAKAERIDFSALTRSNHTLSWMM